MTYEEYRHKVSIILKKIYDLESDTGYAYNNEVTELELDRNDPSQQFDLSQANRVLESLSKSAQKANYSLCVVMHEGTITKTEGEQYELDGVILECGTMVEVKLYNNLEECFFWQLTTIECDNEGYYLTCNGQHDIEGLEGRLRFR